MSYNIGPNPYHTVYRRDLSPIGCVTSGIMASGTVATLNGRSGHITLVGTSGVSVVHQTSGNFLLSSLSAAAPAQRYLPVDARQASGHIIPDINSIYDLGTSSLKWRDIRSVSGIFSEFVSVAGSGVPVQLVGVSGISIFNDSLGNVVISQASGAGGGGGGGNPVDSRAVTGVIIPDTDLAYDLGIPALRFSLIAAASGRLNEVTSQNIALDFGTSHRSVLGQVSGLSQDNFALSPQVDVSGQIGTPGQRWSNIHAVSGTFSDKVSVSGSGIPVQIVGTSGIVVNNDDEGNVNISQTQGRLIQITTTNTTDINASSTNNLIEWNSQDIIDSDVFTHSTSTNPSRVQVDIDGRYLTYVNVAYDASGGTPDIHYNGKIKFRLNGSTVQSPRGKSGYFRNASSQDESSLMLSMILNLSAEDYVEVLIDRESDMSGEVTITSEESIFYMVKL